MQVERYRKPTRFLHWAIAVSYVVLFITGLLIFLPAPISLLAQDSFTRIFHRVFSIVFIGAPVIYMLTNWKATVKGITEAFKWGAEDIGWLKAAPRYYFLCDEECMPPQGHMNSGQKLWWLMVILMGGLLVVSGLVMWLLKTVAPAAVLQWMVFAHDVAFIASGSMFFVHVYLSVMHPLMRPLNTGAWASMAYGKVPAEYVKSHHAKWYNEEIAPAQKPEVESPRKHPARVT
ncbi:MAG: hypothetical protein A2147_09975 [Chloroflexi bacterium RBG_16_57_8]|nr:MAG: hypothetical protein A2147_09975 [Chloroflexi bacterium RBG_16_57_8]